MVEDQATLRKGRSRASGPLTGARGCRLGAMAHVEFLQCELGHPHQAAHLAMCLFAHDLAAAGHTVGKTLVSPGALEEFCEGVPAEAELLVLDSIFTFEMIRTLKENSGLPVLVGGHNALQHVLRGPADYAVVGPGRTALSAFVGGKPHHEIPGLWFRDPLGRLDCGPPAPRPSLRTEVFPFVPQLDWSYLGPLRNPGSNLNEVSVVADFGCVWNRSILDSSDGAMNSYVGVEPRLPDVELSSRAADEIQRLMVAREGGCSFCVLRYSERRTESTDAVLPLVLDQIRHLDGQAAGISLQTEHPIPLLAPLLDSLEEAGLRPFDLVVRTIPWLLLKHQAELEHAIQRCGELGIRLQLTQVGFEAFDEISLLLFHKGLSPEDNRRAARLLTDLSEAYSPQTFLGTGGHGLIPLHPWTRPDDLRTNLEVCRADAPWLLPSLSPDRRVEIYAEWTPLFWKAQDWGLLRRTDHGFGWDWSFDSDDTGEVVAAWSALLSKRPNRKPLDAPEVLGQVLDIWEQEEDPGKRRKAYIQLRDG